MLTEAEKACALDFLNFIPEDDKVCSLAASVLKGQVTPKTRSEAVEALVLYTRSVSQLFRNNKVTKPLFLSYLLKHHVPADVDLSKEKLVSIFLSHCGFQDVSSVPLSSKQPISANLEIKAMEDMVRSHKLAKECTKVGFEQYTVNFAKEFYRLLNDTRIGSERGLNSSHFVESCSAEIVIQQGVGRTVENRQGTTKVIKLLMEMNQQLHLLFHVNSESVQGSKEAHGMILCAASGTVYSINSAGGSSGNACGIFDQKFVLQDEHGFGTYKILTTTLILTDKLPQFCLPSSCNNNKYLTFNSVTSSSSNAITYPNIAPQSVPSSTANAFTYPNTVDWASDGDDQLTITEMSSHYS